MPKKNSVASAKVDAYIEKHKAWQGQLTKLRELLMEAGFDEEVKWGGPCYTINGRNLVGLGAYKAHIALWFHQGALLEDKENRLINAQEGKTRALRQWRFTQGESIPVGKVRGYLKQVIACEQAGKRIAHSQPSEKSVPGELATALSANKNLADAFAELSMGQRNQYAMHVAEAKRAETRVSRAEKVIPMILAGQGLNDKYQSQK